LSIGERLLSFEQLAVFDLIRVAPVLAVMAVAAFQDAKTGQASNKLWLYTPFGTLLTLVELWLMPILWLPILLSGIMACGLVFAAYKLNGMGGADVKAVIMISLCTPTVCFMGHISTVPLTMLLIGGLTGTAYGLYKKQRILRFLPFLFIGLLISIAV